MEKNRKELYFKHEPTSMKDPQMLRLIDKYSGDGYMVYFLLREYLWNDTLFIDPENIPIISRGSLATPSDKAIEIINYCLEIGLLKTSEEGEAKGYIYCPKLIENKKAMDEKSHINAINGSKGGRTKAANAKKRLANATEDSSERLANANQNPSERLANKNITKKEKENNKQKQNINNTPSTPSSCNEQNSLNAQSNEAEEEKEEELTEFSLLLADGSYYQVRKKDYDVWKNAYREINIPEQFKLMNIWLESNFDDEKKRKNEKQIRRFINNWLKGENDKAKERGNKRPEPVPMSKQQCKPPVVDDCPF